MASAARQPVDQKPQSALIQLIALADALPADKASLTEKQQRDRQIAQNLAKPASSPTDRDSSAKRAHEQPPLTQIDAWLNTIGSPETRQQAQHWARGWQLSQTLVGVLGVLSGIGVGAVTLYYDGSAPINIVDVWLVLVGLPLLMWLLWLLTLLPFRLPLISALSELIQHGLFAPLQGWLQKRFSADKATTSILNRFSAHWKTHLLGVLMQQFALGLTAGSLLALLYLLASSDLAFAWSTSLAISAEQFHQLTHRLAWPFAHFFAEASPGLALVESSQFFRLDDTRAQQFSAEAPSQLTQWWPFLAASIAFYAVLPRLIGVWLAKALLKRATRAELLAFPGVSALLARMNAPTLLTTPDTPQPDTATPAERLYKPREWSLRAPLVCWGKLDTEIKTLKSALKKVGLDVEQVYQAGGLASLDDDQQLIEKLVKADAQGVLLAVKSWEPPMGEFRDWLATLRTRGTKQMPVIVLLLDVQEGVPAETDIAVWQADLEALNDPNLHIEPVAL